MRTITIQGPGRATPFEVLLYEGRQKDKRDKEKRVDAERVGSERIEAAAEIARIMKPEIESFDLVDPAIAQTLQDLGRRALADERILELV